MNGKEPPPEMGKSGCRWCNSEHQKKTAEKQPLPLQNFTREIVKALRPMDLEVGPQVREPGGYRKKTRMTTFSWPLQSVQAKIETPEDEASRKKALKAFKFLKKDTLSHYKHFHAEHRRFLEKREGRPSKEQARQPVYSSRSLG